LDRHKFTFPVLLDSDGQVAATYAPVGVLPDLPRHEVPIASNLIIDQQGKIQFYTLLDSQNFDAKLIALTKKLNQLIEKK
jgi:peroxiredoxin